MKITRLLRPFLLLALVSTAFAATPLKIIEKMTAEQMVKYLRDCELPGGKIDKDDDVIIKIHSVDVLVMVGSTKQTLVKFKFSTAGSKANLRTVNDWNRDRSFTKAFLDSDGDPVLEMDLDLEGGVTEARLRDAIKTYDISLKAFLEKLKELQP